MKSKNILANLHEAVAGILSGAAAGVLLGIGARLAMRMVALAAFFPPRASMVGTLEIILVCVLIGGLGGLLFTLLEHLLPGSLWSGPLFGIAFMLLLAPLLLPKLNHEIDILTTPSQVVVAVGSFGLAFYSYGLLLQAVCRRLRHWRRRVAVSL